MFSKNICLFHNIGSLFRTKNKRKDFFFFSRQRAKRCRGDSETRTKGSRSLCLIYVYFFLKQTVVSENARSYKNTNRTEKNNAFFFICRFKKLFFLFVVNDWSRN